MDNMRQNKKTAMGRISTNSRNSVSSWLRQRILGKNKSRRAPVLHNFISRLEVEASLRVNWDAHEPLFDWNQQGDLLAKANNDGDIFLLDVFKQRQRCVATTGHDEEVLAFKFMPAPNDTKAVTSDYVELRQTDLSTGRNSLLYRDERIAHAWIIDLAVHPSEPNLIWGVRMDGYLLQHDLRQPQTMHYYLYTGEVFRCLAANPLRSEMLAVGSDGAYIALYDRRVLKSDKPSPCIANFGPVHDKKKTSGGTEDLAFNSDGSELIATLFRRQVHLFHTYAPWEKYQSFDLSIEPLLTEKPQLKTCTPSKVKPYSYLNELRKQCPIEMQHKLKTLCDDILTRTSIVEAPNNMIDHINKLVNLELGQTSESINETSPQPSEIIDSLNVLLDKVHNCPDLYQARAKALITRGWLGDSYQSFRDCCCALALKPLDFGAICCLSATLVKIGNKEDVRRLLEFVETTIKEFGENEDLLRSKEMLRAFKSCDKDKDLKLTSASTLPADPFHLDVNSQRCARAFDHSRRYCIKEDSCDFLEARFFGSDDEFVVGGSYDGVFYIWDKNTTNLVRTVQVGEGQVFVRPHPSICMLATCGLGDVVKLWSPGGSEKNVEEQEGWVLI